MRQPIKGKTKMIRKRIKIRNLRYIMIVYFILLLVMFILPFYSAEGYSLFKNTTSQLGAQNTPNSWIMNITFGLLGLASILEVMFHLRRFWFQKVMLSIFGLSLILTAVFSHAPIIENLPYNEVENQLHSIFASIVGFSFTVFSVSVAFIEQGKVRRILALFVGLTATVLSLLMFYISDYSGLWQRVMFVISFAWLIFLFEGMRVYQDS